MKRIVKLTACAVALFLLLTTQKAHPQLADSPWPMFRHDPQHTGRSQYVVSDSLELTWTFKTKESIQNEPVIGSDGTIYLVSYREGIYALRPDGSKIWEYKLENSGYYGFTTSPVLNVDGTIYVGGGNPDGGSALYAFSPDGTIKWKFRTGRGYVIIDSSPLIDFDGTIYIGSADDTLFAVNPNGTLKWKYGVSGSITSSPALGHNGNIHFISADGNLYSMKPNGTFAWKIKVIDDPYYPTYDIHPMVGSDGVIYCTYQPYSSVEVKLQAINQDGTLKWKSNLAGEMIALGASGNLYFSDGMSYLYSLLPNSEINWKIKQNADFISMDNNDVLYAAIGPRNNAPGRNPDTLYAINPNSTSRWKIGLGNKLTSPPVIDSDGTIYVAVESSGPNEGKLCCLKASKTGTPDLAVDDVFFDPVDGTNVGAEINISAVIKDVTNTSSARCLVSFYYDNRENLIDTVSIYVPYGGDANARVKWYTQNYEPKNYQVIVEISNAKPTETNTNNNTYSIVYPIYPTIQSRINTANDGDTLWVEAGTYFENIQLKNHVLVKSKMGTEKTILNGKGVASVVSASWLQNSATLEGFTITNGKGVPYGGGVYIERGGANIKGNIIKNNTAAQGGGIFIIGIINASYPNNPLISQNIITENDADRGEAILTNNSQARIYNNTIVANGEIVNGQRTGDGIWSEGVYFPTPDIRNCIIWDNGDDMTGNPFAGGAIASYSCIEDGDPGTGNISTDPLFVDLENGNYHLQAIINGYPQNSPCIDAGTGTDPDGTPADMGAFWVAQSGMFATISGTITNAVTGNPIEGAMLILSGPESDTTWSDNNGIYRFMVQGGSGYSIEVSALNYQTASKQNISAAAGETTVVDFALQPYLEPPKHLQATVSPGKVTLEWQPPVSTMQEELAFDDGSFENAMGWDNMQGIAANGPFQPSNYPVSIDIARVAFNGERGGDPFKVHIYLDPSGVADRPSSTMLAGSVGPLSISSSGTFQDVDLRPLNLTLNSGRFFIGIQQLGSNPMWILFDESGSGDNSFIDSNLDGIFSPLNELDPPESAVFAIRAVVSSQSILGNGLAVKAPEVEGVRKLTRIDDKTNKYRGGTREITFITLKEKRGRENIIISATKSGVFIATYFTLTGYNLYRSQSSPVELSGANRIASVSQEVTSYEDTDVVGGQTYYYVVTAIYEAGESEPSNQVEATIPTGGPGPTVRIEPIFKEIQIHQSGTISVILDSVDNLGSYEFTIHYDPQIIQIANQEDVKLGPFLGSTGRTVSPVGPIVDNDSGKVTFGAFSFGNNPAPSIDRGGVLATISWTAQDSGVTVLDLSDIKLTHPDGSEIPNVKAIHGQINVSQCYWADVDCDGDVDIVDIQLVAGRWNCSCGDPCYDPRYDIDDDCDIDIVDIQRVAGQWGWPNLHGTGFLGKIATAGENGLGQILALRIEPKGNDKHGDWLIDVVVENATDLSAFQFDLVFNNLVKVKEVHLGELMANSENNVVVLEPKIDQASGKLAFGAFSYGKEQGVSGSGVLAHIRFESKSDGEQPLKLENVQFTDRWGNLLPVAEIANATIGKDALLAIPKTFTLGQNYPNPFNPTTTITFGIPDQSGQSVKVNLSIYNLNGQLIKTLLDEDKQPGHYTFEWDGTDEKGQQVSTGLYFYSIEAGNYRATKKMIFTK